MIGLLSFAVRAVLLAGFTFGFVVLFEHGPQGFVAGAPVEWRNFGNFLASLKTRQAEAPAAAPEPAPAPPPSAAAAPVATPIPVSAPPAPPAPKAPPSAWEQLQSKPMGEGLDASVATPFPTN